MRFLIIFQIPAHSATLDQIKCVHSEALVAKMQQMAHQAQKSKQTRRTRCRYNNFGEIHLMHH